VPGTVQTIRLNGSWHLFSLLFSLSGEKFGQLMAPQGRPVQSALSAPSRRRSRGCWGDRKAVGMGSECDLFSKKPTFEEEKRRREQVSGTVQTIRCFVEILPFPPLRGASSAGSSSPSAFPSRPRAFVIPPGRAVPVPPFETRSCQLVPGRDSRTLEKGWRSGGLTS
jgi:hypothetical protein